MLDLSRQRIHMLRRTHDDFPPPADELACGPVWHEKDVERWLRDREPKAAGRPPRR